MLAAINRILFATYVSKNASYAFGYAVAVAERFGTRVSTSIVPDEIPEGYISERGPRKNRGRSLFLKSR